MAKKDKEKAQAYVMFMEGKQQNEIATRLRVSEKTISRWANDGKWQSIRVARAFSNTELSQNKLKELVIYSELRLDLMAQLEAERALPKEQQDKNILLDLIKQIATLADAASKTDKQGDKQQKENRITLTVYLDIMDEIFKALQNEDQKLHDQTLDFQERHVHFIAKKLG